MTQQTHTAPALSLATAALLATLLGPSGAQAQTQAQPEPGPAWEIVGNAHAARDKDLSGMACTPEGQCLLISDEKTRSWLFRLDRSDPAAPRLRITAEIELTPSAPGKEADAEAAAFDRGHFYAVGSHGTTRRGNQFQASRFSVYRLTPDGRSEASGALTAQLAAQPEIAGRLCTPATVPCRPLGEGGVNIEGLAARDGLLYVGLRAPLDAAGRAMVLRTPAASLFDGAAPDPTLFHLVLGTDALNRGLGVRDIAAVSNGFLILAGPALPEGDGPGSGTLFHWSGGTEPPARLGPVGEPAADVKPEGLLVLAEDGSGWTVLVLHDGIEGGRPREYRVPRPR